MKKLFLAALLALMLTGCGSNSSTSAESAQQVQKKTDIVFINMTAMEINNLYISVTGMDAWGDSELSKNRIFRRGEELTLKREDLGLKPNEMYDLKCEAKNGDTIVFSELALYSIKKITLTADESGNTYTVIKQDESAAESESETVQTETTTEAETVE